MTMLTEAEYTAAMAKLTEGQTEIDALEQVVRDHINKAREHNHARAVASNRKTALQHSLQPLIEAVNQHNMEVAAEQNRQRVAEAEANAAKARQEAEKAKAEEAAKPKLEDVMRELAELKAKVEGQK